MSNCSIQSEQGAAEPYTGVHARTAMIYADRDDAVGLSEPSKSVSTFETSVRTPVRIDLPHIGVVLLIAVEGRSSAPALCLFPSATTIMTRSDVMRDPVVERLFCDFNRPEVQHSNLSGIYTDAIRLAVLARCLGLRSPGAAALGNKPAPATLPMWRLKRVTDYIDEHIGEPLSLADLAEAAGLSKMYFAAQFRAATGLRPHEYVLRRRIDHAKDLLTETEDSLVETAFSVGFQTQAHFTTVFKRIVGAPPAQWRSLAHIL